MAGSLCVRPRRWFGWSVLVLLAFMWPPAMALAQAPNALFSDERTDRALAPAAAAGTNPMVRRSRTTTVNLQMLTAPAPAPSGWAAAAPVAARSVDLNLFSDVNLVAFFDHAESVAAVGGTAWVGTVSGVEGSQVILSIADGVFAGVINLPDRMYSVRRALDGTYVIAEINRSAIPPDGDPIDPHIDRVLAANVPPTAAADGGDTFDLLLYYTTTVKNVAGGLPAINALLTASIAEVNAVYISSGIPSRLRLVGAIEMNYAETGDMSVDLPALQRNATAQADRNRLAADFVTLLISRSESFSGLAYTMNSTSVNQNFAPFAYSVVLYYDFINYVVALAHELAHNMGCLHEPGNNNNNGAFAYSQGYTDFTHKFYDVMSYGLNCTGCTQIAQFSSPINTYQGNPTGTATQDNQRTIMNTRTTVANFRTSVAAALGAPTNLSASSSGSNVSLSWSAGSGRPTGYTIEAGTASGKADITTLNTGSTATSLSAANIANGLYYIRVYATDGVTTSQASNEAVLQVGACASAPTAPSNLTNSVAGSTVFLEWSPGARATAYVIEAGSASGLSNLVNNEVATNAFPGGNQVGGYPNQVSFSASGVGAGTFYVRVRAKNACGPSAASNETVVVIH